MKGCELCPGTARMYCESDDASLCFECDARVHGANFLVARHSRTLLCRRCQSHTPWKAAGARLSATVSVCESCLSLRSKHHQGRVIVDHAQPAAAAAADDDQDSEEEEEEEEDDDDDDEEEQEEGEEQVVPLTTEGTAPLPPAAASSSSSSGAESTGTGRSLKRTRGNLDLAPSCSSSEDQFASALASRTVNRTDDEATADSFRPLKDHKRSDAAVIGSSCPPT